MSLRTRLALLVAALALLLTTSLGGYLWHTVKHASLDALDRELQTSADILGRLVHLESDGEIELEDHGAEALRIPHRIESRSGEVISESGLRWPALHEGRIPAEAIEAARVDDRPWRILTRRLDLRRKGRSAEVILRVAVSTTPTIALRERMFRAVLVATAVAAIAGAIGAALVAGTTTRPLRRLAEQVSRMEAASLHDRIEPHGGDREIVALTSAFNGLLERLEAAFERQRSFVARASHSLRTPTTTILTTAEVTLARPRSEEAYRQSLEAIARAARESAALVRHLLSLARLEERTTELRPEPIGLASMASDLERLLERRAEAAGVALSFDIEEGATIVADRAALREMLEAILDNALRYTPRGGSAGLRAADHHLVVWDTGPGMSDEEKARAFERFFRGQAAERSGAVGSGLGLAIACAVAERHGAAITLADREGGGLEVTVRWPGYAAVLR